jgi:predicted esterase
VGRNVSPLPNDGDPPLDATIDAGLDATVVTPRAHWELNRAGPNRFLLPWPSDLTLTPEGYLDLRYIPNEGNNALVRDYVSALERRIAGFSTVGATYFRFSVPLDPSTLPADAAASREPGSSVQLIDVDATSPDRGRRLPLQVYFRERGTRYWYPNTLAVAPAYGFPLRPRTRYAVVITRRVRATGGAPIERDADLSAVLAPSGGDEAVTRARALHEPAVVEIERAGVARSEILSLAVFTTQDPTRDLFRAVEVARTLTPAPEIIDVTRTDGIAFTTYAGHYGPSPVFQSGAPPYDAVGSGDFVLDATGNPRVQRMENITFALTVPTGEPPAEGWPVVVYAHGTGGNARSFIGEGVAASLAAQGLAVFSFDQIFNGDRTIGAGTGGSAEAQFFNFQNPLAGRTNNRQAAIDLVTAGRLVRAMRIPADVAAGGREVHFDPTRVTFFGHSQGGLNGPLWLAAEDVAGAAVLSGAGGTLTLALTQKTEPINIPRILALVLGISTSNPEELVPLHPVLTMAQTVVDAADPVNYARHIVREPREGHAPHHVYMTQGFVDHYTPPDAIGSLALAVGLQLIEPVPHPVAVYPLTGLTVGAAPLRLNLGEMRATGVWQQFDAPPRRDGHFVVFDVAAARDRAAAFLGSYARDPMRIPSVQ